MKRVMKATLMVAVSLCLAAMLALAPTVQAETIKIGAILAVTGGASFLGGPES